MRMRDVGRLKKADEELSKLEVYDANNVDNVVVLVRLHQNNPAMPQEIRIELEPDGPEEAAVLGIVDDGIAKKQARLNAEFDKVGMTRTARGMEPKGGPA